MKRDKFIPPFRVNEEEKRIIEKCAYEWHTTVSAYVRHAVMTYSSNSKGMKTIAE